MIATGRWRKQAVDSAKALGEMVTFIVCHDGGIVLERIAGADGDGDDGDPPGIAAPADTSPGGNAQVVPPPAMIRQTGGLASGTANLLDNDGWRVLHQNSHQHATGRDWALLLQRIDRSFRAKAPLYGILPPASTATLVSEGYKELLLRYGKGGQNMMGPKARS